MKKKSFSLCVTMTNKYLHGLVNSYINLSNIELNTYHRHDAVCILITLPESILGVYHFPCVDACIPIQYKCIDTNELYFYSYRIVYSILVGAGYMYIYMYICIYVCMCIYTYIFMCVCICIYTYACECMLLCIHDYMYVFYVCSFYVCWFYDVFLPMVAWSEMT